MPLPSVLKVPIFISPLSRTMNATMPVRTELTRAAKKSSNFSVAMRYSVLAFCFALSIVSPVFSLKVLVYQTAFGGSHVQFSGTLVDALVERGHIVVGKDSILT